MTSSRRWPSSAPPAACGPGCCGSSSASANLALRFHTQTAGSTLTAQQPENNLARAALQALSAVLGGTQSLHVNGYDEALALPSEESARLALRTQQILAKESGVAQTVDPLAGSYYVESLTTAIEQEARAISTGSMRWAAWWPRSNGAGCSGRLKMLPTGTSKPSTPGETVVVGVNRFAGTSEEDLPPVGMSTRRGNGADGARTRLPRPPRSPSLAGGLRPGHGAGPFPANLMPAILEAVESCATVGEIAGSLRKVFGEYRA